MDSPSEMSEMPVLFSWALKPQCSVRKRKIVVFWARSSLQFGSSCAWYLPFSDVDSAATIFHFFLSRPLGVDMSPDIVGNLSAVRARVRFLSSPGSCSFEVMPGALRNMCMSDSLLGL